MPPSILVGLKDRGVLTAVEAAKIRAEQFPHPSPVVGDGPPGRGVPHAPITAPGGTEQ
jgi:hypothetical protein